MKETSGWTLKPFSQEIRLQDEKKVPFKGQEKVHFRWRNCRNKANGWTKAVFFLRTEGKPTQLDYYE